MTKDQDNNIILVAVDHIRAGEEVESHLHFLMILHVCVQQ